MKKFSVILAVLLLIPLLTVPGFAADIYGAKAQGMGGAFVAVVDDATAIYWNPAGLAQNSLIGLQANAGGEFKPQKLRDITKFITDVRGIMGEEDKLKMAKDLEDLDYPEDAEFEMRGMTAVNLSKLGVGVILEDRPSLTKGEEISVGSHTVSGATAQNKFIGQGMAGLGLNLINPPVVGKMSVGANGKVLFGQNNTVNINPQKLTDGNLDEAIVDTQKTDYGFGTDVGALVTLSDIDILNVKAGASIRNLLTVGVDEDSFLDSATERTTTLGAGVTFKFPLVNILTARVAADLEMPENGDAIQHIGAEGTLGLFSLRAGAYGSDLAADDQRTLTAGFGFNLPFLDFNLAADSEKNVNFSGTFNF